MNLVYALGVAVMADRVLAKDCNPEVVTIVEKNVQDFILEFTSIFYEALPFIILGSALAGLLEEFVPQQFIARVIPRRPLLAIAMSALLGLVFPMCECGIIVVMRRLLRKGLPLSSCVAYMLAGPIINPVVMFSTYMAFAPYEARFMGGFWMVALRVGMGYCVAVVTALVVERLARKHGNQLLMPLALPPAHAAEPAPANADGTRSVPATEAGLRKNELETAGEENAEEDEEPAPTRSWMQRLNNISETALHDFVDITVFLTLGALITCVLRQVLDPRDVEDWARAYPARAIGYTMVLAVVMCLCSEADAFVAANFGAIVPAAKLAFLVLGPMLDIKLFLMYTRVFRPRLIWTIIACVVVQVFIYALLVLFAWERWMDVPAAPGP